MKKYLEHNELQSYIGMEVELKLQQPLKETVDTHFGILQKTSKDCYQLECTKGTLYIYPEVQIVSINLLKC